MPRGAGHFHEPEDPLDQPEAPVAPVTGVNVTVPTDWPFRVSCPPGLTATLTDAPAEAAAPSRSATLRVLATPFAAWPLMLTLMLQGWTVTVCPTANGDPAGNVDEVTAKMQEPKVVVPVAVLAPEAIENAGVVAVLVNATVVVAVVPKEATPEGNANGVFATAAVVVGDAARLASAAATWAGSSLPPQAARKALANRASTSFKVLFI